MCMYRYSLCYKQCSNKPDILDKALSVQECVSDRYSSYRDGEYFKENSLLNDNDFKIALGLYIDDFEVANPFRYIKRQTQNVCSVLGVSKHRCEVQVNSSLHPTCTSL